jgi:hypothetical protein
MFKKKRCFIIYFAVFFLLVFFQLPFPEISHAAIHYVSNSGKTTWADSTNINTPCSVSTAFLNAVAGDVVYFRGGTYTAGSHISWYHGYYEPTNSGTAGNPITFAAYPGETPLFNGVINYPSGAWCPDEATIFAIHNPYITFDGFSLQADGGNRIARIFIGKEDDPRLDNANIIIKNCTINVGTTLATHADNHEAILIHRVNYVTIQRSKIYSTTNHGLTFNVMGGIKSYYSDYVTVENCEFYHVSHACYSKNENQFWTIRYNFIHDNYIAIEQTPWGNASVNRRQRNHKIYHNVLVNNFKAGIRNWTSEDLPGQCDSNDIGIYNNTIYGLYTNDGYSGGGISVGNSLRAKIYNNIVQGYATQQFYFGGIAAYASMSECNYNNWGSSNLSLYFHPLSPDPSWISTSLANWRLAKVVTNVNPHPDVNGLAIDPKFANGSGNLNQLNDFRLASNSPCKGTGKGGIDMGANIELIVLPPQQ